MNTLYCDKCGELQFALLNGYDFGDTLLEGVAFEVSIQEKLPIIRVTPAHAAYFSKLNEIKWLGKAYDHLLNTDAMECPKCFGGIDNPFEEVRS